MVRFLATHPATADDTSACGDTQCQQRFTKLWTLVLSYSTDKGDSPRGVNPTEAWNKPYYHPLLWLKMSRYMILLPHMPSWNAQANIFLKLAPHCM